MGVPAYMVLPEAVLERISSTRPETRAELSRIPGLGPRALMAFGDELLDLCRTAPTAIDT